MNSHCNKFAQVVRMFVVALAILAAASSSQLNAQFFKRQELPPEYADQSKNADILGDARHDNDARDDALPKLDWPEILQFSGTIIVYGTDRSESITISDPDDGFIYVEVRDWPNRGVLASRTFLKADFLDANGNIPQDEVIFVEAGGGDDFISNRSRFWSELAGQDGDDNIGGGQGVDEIHGGDGNDVLIGFEGDDHLYGDQGSDTLDGREGTDNVVGGPGDDYLEAREGELDYVTGGSGNDEFDVDPMLDVHDASRGDILNGSLIR